MTDFFVAIIMLIIVLAHIAWFALSIYVVVGAYHAVMRDIRGF